MQMEQLMALLDTSDGSEVTRVAKRKREGGEDNEEDENGGAPPINDIYRSRQQKRVHNVS